MLTSQQVREKFFNYWASSPRNCKDIPNMSLVPNVDSTLLFVNSGMFPLAPYLAGQPHPQGTRLCDIQRCLRTNYDEMIEIGDNRHTLMFEMMGDWSLGDFFKEEQIPWIMEFWVEQCGFDPSRLYVTVFEGDEDAPRDDEAIQIWKDTFKKYGVEAEYSEDISNLPKNLVDGKTWKPRIFPYPKKKNWWERAHAPNELGGPTSEMFYDLGEIQVEQDKYHVNDDSGRFIEIGNNVFMQYRLDSNMKWQPLSQKNIDFGGGFERVVMIAQGKNDIYETDIYMPIINKVEELSEKSYKTDEKDNEFTANFRIIADHGRAATFILADGVTPSNKDQGYILRRFIRRLVRFGKKLGIEENFTKIIAESVIERMKDAYPHLEENKDVILEKIDKEETVFKQTLSKGLKEIENHKTKFRQYLDEISKVKSGYYEKLMNEKISDEESIRREYLERESHRSLFGDLAFDMYQTFGFPLEMILDEFDIKDEDDIDMIKRGFEAAEILHRNKSRAGAEKKFTGGLADQSRETTKLHTAHHLLLAALQKIVDPSIKQRGSNITAERLRIDFNYNNKLTEEQIKQVEEFVNHWINEELDVIRVEIPKQDAEKLGAQMEFGQKYGDLVSVYYIPDSDSNYGEPKPWPIGQSAVMFDPNKLPDKFVSIEFCGGPHVQNTSELAEGGKKFKILKEESSGSGIRRIKAALV